MWQEIVNLITNVGFPIAMVVYMAMESREMRKEYQEMINKLRDSHAEESAKFAEVIANNTLALQKLSDLLNFTQTE